MENQHSRDYPRRPPRLTQLFSSTHPFYFVTFNTYRRQPLLARPEVHASFRNFSLRAEDYDISVGRYVIMPDHLHLFVFLPQTDITLAKWVQMLRTCVGKELLRLGNQKPHWQEGFFDHVLRSAESYAHKWEYVRMNPVRAGLCRNPEEWPHTGEIVPIQFSE